MLQSTTAPAARMKPKSSIVVAWQDLFERRRQVQPGDAEAIHDPGVRAKIWADWRNDWLSENLTEKQRLYKRSVQLSMVTPYMAKRCGETLCPATGG